jgi:hypothetical protein
MSWSFASIWNESLEKGRPERELKARSRIWASEMGSSFIDRYLKMTAVAPTNPPNPRSMRKFEAGNMMEWLVGIVLKRAGICIDNQEWLGHQYPGLLEVSGKFDFYAGGKPDWSKAAAEVKRLELPEFFSRATDAIIKHFKEKYPDGLTKIILEVKSCSNFMMERYEKKGVDSKHGLQIFHYLKAKNMPEGHVVYICKDDLRMAEFALVNPSDTEAIYKKDIEMMTGYLQSQQMPPKELEIYFDEIVGKFSANWKVGYSNYLTMLYGYQNQKEYDDKYKPLVSKFNRVLKRCVQGDKMTPKNLQCIDEILELFPDFQEILDKVKKDPQAILEEPEEVPA